jgi:hypothetical protein
MGQSVNPSAQDPDAQADPDAWIMEIQDYLKGNILPDEYVSNDVLMQCITCEDGWELLVEIHGSECGNHASSHTLVFGMASTILQPFMMPSSW